MARTKQTARRAAAVKKDDEKPVMVPPHFPPLEFLTPLQVLQQDLENAKKRVRKLEEDIESHPDTRATKKLRVTSPLTSTLPASLYHVLVEQEKHDPLVSFNTYTDEDGAWHCEMTFKSTGYSHHAGCPPSTFVVAPTVVATLGIDAYRACLSINGQWKDRALACLAWGVHSAVRVSLAEFFYDDVLGK